MEQTQNQAINVANPRPYLRWARTAGLVFGGIALSQAASHYETLYKASHLKTPFMEYSAVAAPLLAAKVGGIGATLVGMITASKIFNRSKSSV